MNNKYYYSDVMTVDGWLLILLLEFEQVSGIATSAPTQIYRKI